MDSDTQPTDSHHEDCQCSVTGTSSGTGHGWCPRGGRSAAPASQFYGNIRTWPDSPESAADNLIHCSLATKGIVSYFAFPARALVMPAFANGTIEGISEEGHGASGEPRLE
jgi:hypothetical protein